MEIESYLKDNKFSAAARILEELSKNLPLPEAISLLEKAYEYYEMDESIISAYRCLLESAYMLIEIKEYKRSLAYLEKVSNYYSNDNKLKFEIIAIHMFLGEMAECKKLLCKYKTTPFGKSKEYNILHKTVNARNKTAFLQAICDLEDSWSVDLLLEVKDRLN
jgi:hypothetical protein